jgi:long-chain acyl-CoA synthetase
MLVQNGLQENSLRQPEKVALVCGCRRSTYSELNSTADRLAAAMQDIGVCRGDRVAILLPNVLESVVALFATLKCGAAFVAINDSTKPEKLSDILHDCEPVVVVTNASLAARGKVEAACRSLNRRAAIICTGDPAVLDVRECLSYERIQQTFPASPIAVEANPEDLACLIYTSGSIGEPKGVMCSHESMVFVAASVISYLENTEADVIMNVLPLSFSYGLYQALMAFTFGGTLVLERSFAYPAVLLERIAKEQVTGLPGVPSIFAVLLRMDLTAFDLSSLRYMTNAAAALPPAHIQELRRRLPWVKLFSMYGLTETKRALYLPAEQIDRRPGSVGIAIPGTEVWIEDEIGNRLGPNQIGELIVCGRHVMQGYWRAPEATAARFRPGLRPRERICRTGDLFRMDDDGYLYFVSREDDVINTRGEKVAPREVEAVLHRMDGVAEAAVLGVQDPLLGQAVKAVLVADTARVNRVRVLAHCRANLEEYMVPKYVEFRSELPKTASGKVLRRSLL